MSSAQKDNGSLRAKQRQRLRFTAELGDDARVLEGFTGKGAMYRACWSRFARGATIDKDEAKVRQACKRRPYWACYAGHTDRALAAGWMGHWAFDVVDLDAYGSPWPFVRAWFTPCDRRVADVTHLFLTDGYMRQASIATRCRALFPEQRGQRGDMPGELYLETAQARVAQWAAGVGSAVEWVETRRDQRMALHYLRVSKLGCGEGDAIDGIA